MKGQVWLMPSTSTDIAAAMTPLQISAANLSTSQDSLSPDQSFRTMVEVDTLAPPSSSPPLSANYLSNESTWSLWLNS